MSMRQIAVGAAILAAAMSGPAHALLTWPSPACNSTLQACVAGAASGETVELATNGPITESVQVVDKSLTVQPAAGFTPVFASPGSLDVEAAGAGASLVVDGLTFDDATAVADAASGQGVTLRVYNSTFASHNRSAVRALSDGGALGVILDVRDSHFTITNDGGFEGAAVQLSGVDAFSLDLNVTDNVISQDEGDAIGAISLYSANGRLTAWIAQNEIRRSGHNRGVFLRYEDIDEAFVAVLNNLIVGSPDTSGMALELDATEEESHVSFVIHSNTLADGDRGVLLRHPESQDGAAFEGSFFDNVVANFPTSGFNLDAGANAAFVDHHHNLFFDAPSNVPLGPATVTLDPQFLGGGDYHLTSDSPARNAGTEVGLQPGTHEDLDGHPRPAAADGIVDIGAYEFQGSPLDVPTLSGLGMMLLVGALALAAVRLLRR